MNAFQIIGLTLVSVMTTVSLTLGIRRRIRRSIALTWLLLWIAAAVAIARPGLTVEFAWALGIGRGADLVFYFAVLAMLIGFFMVYVWLFLLEASITKLVRQVAIQDALLREGREGEQFGGLNPVT